MATTIPLKPGTTFGTNVHRIPPHSIEAEQGAIGSVLAEASMGKKTELAASILEAQAQISDAHFYVPANRTIWSVLCSMFDQKKPLDFIAVTQELRDRNLLDSVGGASYITSLFTFVPTADNIEYYLEILREKFILREIIAMGTEAVRRAYEEQDNVPELLDEVQEKFTAIALHKLIDSPVRHIKQDVEEVIEEFDVAHDHRGRTQGIATGFHDLDRMTNGLNEGEMIVLAARPSMGKTAFAMNIAEHAAMERWHTDREGKQWRIKANPVVVFSLETSRHRLVRRMMCAKAHVSLQRLRDGHLKEQDFSTITDAASKLMSAPIYIDETAALRLFDFKARARYAVSKLGARLMVIDYVQLMTTGGKASTSPYERANELTSISATIKATARELNVPIIAIAQLNREAEKNVSGKPRMSNLRECGAFEQDADHVWLLWRGEYYETNEDKKNELAGEAELNIAKQKDGPTGDIKLTFLKEFTKFESRTKELYTPNEEKWQEGYTKDHGDDKPTSETGE